MGDFAESARISLQDFGDGVVRRAEGGARATVVKAWKLEDAKNQFSEVVRRAAHEPQLVTKNGRDAVVVMSVEAYERLAAPANLAVFLRASPFAEALADGLDLSRPSDAGRDVDL